MIFKYSAERSQRISCKAHWAFICDNYLEGFHIPYVHQALNKVIDYGQYETHLFDSGTPQIGIGKKENLVLTFLRTSGSGKAGCGLLLLVLPELDGQCISMGHLCEYC